MSAGATGRATTASGEPEPDRFLRSIDIFDGVDDATLARVAAETTRRVVPGGEVLIHQGDAADRVFVVRTGRLQVRVRRSDGDDVVVGHVGRGEVVGEMALLSDEPRAATVVADRDSEVVCIPMSVFDGLVTSEPGVLRRITGQVVARMRRSLATTVVANPRSTVVVLRLGDQPEVRRAADALVAELRRLEPALALAVPGAEDGPPLAELERTHPIVVSEVAADDPAAETCLRQADLVVGIAAARADAGRRPVEAAVAGGRRAFGARSELVLVHPPGAHDPRGTTRWLEARDVDRHHHVVDGDGASCARAARLLLDRGLVLVLSGGGARGMAEIGVVRAIQEAGIPIDAVGGTSAGALVGAAVARGWDWSRIATQVRTGVAVGRGPVDLTLPALSLAAGRRVTERLQAAAEGLEVEDLRLNFFCVSTNLSRKTPQVHRRGPAWRAVRASLAIPGVFPPVPDGDDVLVDGGLIDNFPVQRMRELHAGATVIGVDVGSRRDLRSIGLPESCVVSGWARLRGAVGRRHSEHAVTMAQVLAGLAELGLGADSEANRPDLLVRPEVAHIAILDFSRFDDLVDAGYRAGRATIGGWLEGEGSRWRR